MKIFKAIFRIAELAACILAVVYVLDDNMTMATYNLVGAIYMHVLLMDFDRPN